MNSAKAISLLTLALVGVFGRGPAAPGEIKTVYVVVPTHLDIGFTAPPDTVARGYKDCIDHAIQLCKKYPDYFYTVECAWQLREWMKRSTREEIAGLSALVKSGKVEIGGAFASMHSGMMSGESVNRMFDLGLSLAKQLGGEISTVIQDDVPGYTWAYPQAMRQHCIRYFLTGINTSFGGKPKLTYKDIPFLWEGPDGSRVLTWIANGYTDASQWGVGIWEKEHEVFRKVPKQTRALEEAGYPYDAFLVMASPGDNVDAAATEKIHRIIANWNSTGTLPVLKMATPRQFFAYMEKRYGGRFPTYRGDWSGNWAPAKLGSPRLIARMRVAQRILPAAESLWSVLALAGAARFPAEDISVMWDDLLTISEHSAAAGTGWPNLTTKEQVIWENWQHAFRSLFGSYGSSTLMQEGMKVLAESVSADHPFVVVFNSLPRKRTQYVEVSLPAEIVQRGLTIIPAQGGKEVEWDLLGDGSTVRFLADGVPGVGYKLFQVSEGGPARKPAAPNAAERLDTARFTIEIDRRTGYVKSIYDKKHRREWVQKNRLLGALHLAPQIDATVGGDPRLAEAGRARIELTSGKTFKTLDIYRSEGALVKTSVTVFELAPVVRIENTLDTSKIPGDDRVVAVLEFPFDLDGESLKIALDGPNHFRSWPDDFLPGTARIGQVVQSYAFLCDERAAVCLIPVEAPILSFGKIGLHSLDKPTSARIYSYLFDREVWGQNRGSGRTRYDEVEPALGTKVSYTYYLDFRAYHNPGVAPPSLPGKLARRSATDVTVPLFARFHSPWGRQKGKLGDATARSFLEIEYPAIELSSATVVSRQGTMCWRLRLQESSGLDRHHVQAQIAPFPIRSAWLLDACNDQRKPLSIKAGSVSVPVSAFRTATIFIERAGEAP